MNCKCNNSKCNNSNSILIFLSILILVITIIVIITNPQEQKDILSIVAVPGDNTTVGTTTINFSRNDIIIGNAMSHEQGMNIVNINETGIYQISYQIYGERQTFGTFNFNAVLLVNDQALEDTFNQSPVIRNSASNRMTLTSTVILRLQAGDTLKLNGVSIEDIRYDNARIDIEKIG